MTFAKQTFNTPHFIADTIVEYMGLETGASPAAAAAAAESDQTTQIKNAVLQIFDTTTENTNAALRLFEDNNSGLRQNHITNAAAFADHIATSRDLILQGAHGLKGHVMILGPGAMEPIDQLLEIFQEVTLVDFDPQSLEWFAKKYKGRVKTICLDLTGGIIKKVDLLFQELAEEERSLNLDPNKKYFFLDGYSAIQTNNDYERLLPIAKRIQKFYAEVVQQPLDISKSLPKADYMISSLVSSMLGNQVRLHVESRFKQLYKEPIEFLQKMFDTYTLYNEFRPYDEAAKTFTTALAVKHIQDLPNLVRPGGRVYYADTMEKGFFEQTGNKRHYYNDHQRQPVIVGYSRLIELCQKLFRILFHKNWDWDAAPAGKYGGQVGWGYKVQGWVLEPDL